MHKLMQYNIYIYIYSFAMKYMFNVSMCTAGTGVHVK